MPLELPPDAHWSTKGIEGGSQIAPNRVYKRSTTWANKGTKVGQQSRLRIAQGPLYDSTRALRGVTLTLHKSESKRVTVDGTWSTLTTNRMHGGTFKKRDLKLRKCIPADLKLHQIW